jgi:hypothetical protein
LMSPPDAEDRLLFLDILTITDLGFLHTHGLSPCSNIKWGAQHATLGSVCLRAFVRQGMLQLWRSMLDSL